MRKITYVLLALPAIFSCSGSIDDTPMRQTVEFSVIHCKNGISFDSGTVDMEFSVSAHLDDRGPATTDYAWNVKVSNKNGTWKSNSPIFWMNGRDITFFAVSPYIQPGMENLCLSTAGEVPAVTYTAPESAVGQTDILAAHDTRDHGAVVLDFRHITSCIQFVTGKDFQEGVSITEIELNGIYRQGTYRLDSDRWESLLDNGKSKISDIGFTMNGNIPEGTPISERYFFLPPQESDIEISISIVENGVRETYTVPAGAIAWKAGKVYKYAISYRGQKMSVSSTESLTEDVTINIDDRNEIL